MGEDYVDYTLLKKKGILKLKEEKFKNSLRTEGGFVDLTGFKNEETSQPTQTETTTNTSNFGFLSDMASIGSNSNITNNNDNKTEVDEKELATLKVKLDDIEYKLERFLERIDKLEEKLTKAED